MFYVTAVAILATGALAFPPVGTLKQAGHLTRFEHRFNGQLELC